MFQTLTSNSKPYLIVICPTRRDSAIHTSDKEPNQLSLHYKIGIHRLLRNFCQHKNRIITTGIFVEYGLFPRTNTTDKHRRSHTIFCGVQATTTIILLYLCRPIISVRTIWKIRTRTIGHCHCVFTKTLL